MYSRSKEKKRNTPIYFNTNYRTETKLVPIIMDYYLLQFYALKFFVGVRLLALAIIPTSNGSQTNVRNVANICFLVICEVNFTISLKDLVVYIEKIKVR